MIGEKWRGYYLTAYGIAVKHGYTGTEEEWLESLVGARGRELELEVIGGNLMCRHEGDDEYKTLLSVEELRGEEIDLLISEISNAKADSIVSAANASASEEQAKSYAENALKSEANASASEEQAKSYAENASKSEANASASEEQAKSYAENASESEANARNSAQSAADSVRSAEDVKQIIKALVSEAETARDEAQEIAGFDPANYVRKNDFAEINGDAGLMYLSSPSFGINLKDTNKDGVQRLIVYGAKDSHVTAKASEFLPLTPSVIDLAVKTGITTNTLELTSEEKAFVANWLGLSRVEIVSYTGTGLGGEENACEVTFSITPRIVVMLSALNANGDIKRSIMELNKLTTEYTDDCGFYNSDTSVMGKTKGKKSANGKTISWYISGDSNCDRFYNNAGVTYYLLGIE